MSGTGAGPAPAGASAPLPALLLATFLQAFSPAAVAGSLPMPAAAAAGEAPTVASYRRKASLRDGWGHNAPLALGTDSVGALWEWVATGTVFTNYERGCAAVWNLCVAFCTQQRGVDAAQFQQQMAAAKS